MQFLIQAAAALSLLSTVHAQYQIDPNSVSNGTKQGWCQQQQSQCPLICLQTSADSSATLSNTCDWTILTYSCVCSNGLSPNVSEYSQTLPYYICQEWGRQCVSNCGLGNNDCSSACLEDHPCGALNPTRVNVTSSSATTTSASSTGSGGSGQTTDAAGQTYYTGFGGGAAVTSGGATPKTNAGVRAAKVWALSVGQTFGTIGLVGAFVGGAAVFL